MDCSKSGTVMSGFPPPQSSSYGISGARSPASGGGEERERSGESAEAKRGASGGLRRFSPLPLPPPSIFSLPRLSLSSPPPLANDLAPEMPYGDDCGGG